MSLFIKSGNFAIGVGHKYEGMIIYNYDLHTGELLSNDELIERFNFTRESVLTKIQKHYDIALSDECDFIDLSEEENIGCHGRLDNFIEKFNEEPIFIDENENLTIMINQYLKNKEIYLTTYYEFNLAAH